ncbi:MAG: alpha/beta fold hydrolase [Pseudomonadota bacterium]
MTQGSETAAAAIKRGEGTGKRAIWSFLRVTLALFLGVWSIWVLESARAGLERTEMRAGPTPVHKISNGGGGPAVVMAHGFAGSWQMMQGYAHVLAQAGYTVYAFDFEGHGRHTVPMSGDVTSEDGTTRLLVNQTLKVIELARLDTAQDDQPVAMLGHSMATDVLVRAAAEAENIGPLVLLATFSGAVTPDHPKNMLLITGEWEPRLQGFANDAVAGGAAGVMRDAMVAPAVEHVAILHSRAGRAASLEWLNDFYDRTVMVPVGQTGWALIGLLAAITVLFAPVTRLFPTQAAIPDSLSWRHLSIVVAVPMVAAPVLSAPLETHFLPVLVADYLAIHLLIYGAVQMALMIWLGHRPGRLSKLGAVLVLVWTIAVFGFALDRYGANFWPTPQRLAIIAALAVGAVPFMFSDSWVVHGASLTHRIVARMGFLVSLAIAVAIDFEGLFFLILIAPVIVLFYFSFGSIGRVSARHFGPTGAGLALGLALAWALGVSFPLFSAA